MRVVLQRVTQASVVISGRIHSAIGPGWLLLLGIHSDDGEADVKQLISKIVELRMFSDEQGKFNKSLRDVAGSVLVVSQFTLYADTSKGRRPAFTASAGPETARPLYELAIDQLRAAGVTVETGVFGANMQVGLINDGPVTIILDSTRSTASVGPRGE